jgi:hypothetical protein
MLHYTRYLITQKQTSPLKRDLLVFFTYGDGIERPLGYEAVKSALREGSIEELSAIIVKDVLKEFEKNLSKQGLMRRLFSKIDSI